MTSDAPAVPAVLLASLLAATPAFTQAPGASSSAAELEQLIARIELRHRSLPHFEVRFEQTFTPRIFGRQRTESGVLTVKRPGRMRWEYREPEPKVFVSDGQNTWFHVPADRQVIVGAFRSPAGTAADGEAEDPGHALGGEVNPLAFLTGELAILDHFDATFEEDASQGLRTLRLTPNREGSAVSFVSLLVEPDSGLILGIESEDPERNRTAFRFHDFRYGVSPENSLFVFRIPPGTEIVTASELRE